MIEVVYKEEKKKPVGNEGFFHIPRNIRQIGEADDDYKIYIEDYAYHYLDRICDDVSGAKLALLLGAANWAEGVTYVFVKSAFELKGMEADENHIVFTDEIWNQAQRTAEEFFPDQEVVGWFFAMPECAVVPTDEMYRVHMNYFAGSDRVLLLRESLDGEEAFFRCDDGKMRAQSGYYLYYERNEAMQNYMVEENHNTPMESGDAVDDRAVKDFRRIILRRKEEQEEKPEKPGTGMMLGTAAAALLLAFVLGTNYLNDFQALKSTRSSVQRVIARVRSGTSGGDEGVSGLDGAGAGPAMTPGVSVAATAMPEGEPPAKEESGLTGTPAEEESSVTGTSEKERDAAGSSARDDGKTAGEEKEATPEPEKSAKNKSRATQEPTSAETFQSYTTYTIRRGDTLTSISRAFYGSGEMIDAICRMNGISRETIIYEGEKILLP